MRKGVISTEVGYTGGHAENPTYKDVCRGDTGHAEAVHVTFDPSIITYDQLLDLFWEIHDPTQHNRQGPDIGSQYRSAIFVHNDEQRSLAEASKQRRQTNSGKKIATQIADAGPFWRAEEYHQQYAVKNGGAGCHIGS